MVNVMSSATGLSFVITSTGTPPADNPFSRAAEKLFMGSSAFLNFILTFLRFEIGR